MDQSRESKEEQSHRVPHPDGDKQEKRGGRRREAPDVGGGEGGEGGLRKLLKILRSDSSQHQREGV